MEFSFSFIYSNTDCNSCVLMSGFTVQPGICTQGVGFHVTVNVYLCVQTFVALRRDAEFAEGPNIVHV
jgi:hypothetical protein